MLTAGMSTTGRCGKFRSQYTVLRRGMRSDPDLARPAGLSVASEGPMVVSWPMRRDRPA